MLTADLLELGRRDARCSRTGRGARPHRRHGRRLLPADDGRPAGREGPPDAAAQGRPPDDRRPADQGRRVRPGRRRHDHLPPRGRPPAAPRPPGAGRRDQRQRPETTSHPGRRAQPEHARRRRRAAARRARVRAHPGDQPGLGRPVVPAGTGTAARACPPADRGRRQADPPRLGRRRDQGEHRPGRGVGGRCDRERQRDLRRRGRGGENAAMLDADTGRPATFRPAPA